MALGLVRKFFGKTVGEAAAFASGAAVARTLHPGLQALTNETWKEFPAVPLDAADAAEIVAEDVELQQWGRDEAIQTGVNGDRFDALTSAVRNAPGLAELFETWRRDLITDAQFEHGLRKAKLEPRWDAPLKALKSRLLSLDELANARQQGFVTPARQQSESELQGLDAERAEIKFEIVGLPPGPETMQFAATRGLADRATFDQAIREGHTKTKYTDLLWAMRQPVLTAQTYAGLHLRGWITQAEMNAGGALHGYTPEQMQQLYLVGGRPATGHQVFIGLRRGGTYDGPTAGIPAPFVTAIRQSNIRPEWTNLLWAGRYNYPSAFVLRGLTQSGDLTADQTHEILLFEGWEPTLARTVADKWATPTAAGADTHAAKAQTQLWNTTHRSYIAAESDDAAATAALQQAGVAAATVPQVLALWQHERALIRKQLTPAQIKKAFRKSAINEATGVSWTRDEALAALVELGYAPLAAADYLNIP